MPQQTVFHGTFAVVGKSTALKQDHFCGISSQLLWFERFQPKFTGFCCLWVVWSNCVRYSGAGVIRTGLDTPAISNTTPKTNIFYLYKLKNMHNCKNCAIRSDHQLEKETDPNPVETFFFRRPWECAKKRPDNFLNFDERNNRTTTAGNGVNR